MSEIVKDINSKRGIKARKTGWREHATELRIENTRLKKQLAHQEAVMVAAREWKVTKELEGDDDVNNMWNWEMDLWEALEEADERS